MEKWKTWMKQAQNDLSWAKHSLDGHFYSQACFVSQQVGEKAIKAYAYFKGADLVKGHSIVKIVKELGINGEILKAALKLDLYYISSRYPDGLPDQMTPSEYFTSEQADEAVLLAQDLLDNIQKLLPKVS